MDADELLARQLQVPIGCATHDAPGDPFMSVNSHCIC